VIFQIQGCQDDKASSIDKVRLVLLRCALQVVVVVDEVQTWRKRQHPRADKAPGPRHRYTPAMSGRKLGGGRILGSGKSLATSAPPAQQRTSRLASPADSLVSEDSRDSTISPLDTSPLPDINQNLSSVVSLQNGGPSAVAAASTKLLCPICNEEMVGFTRCYSK
jgi:hypothetical protein